MNCSNPAFLRFLKQRQGQLKGKHGHFKGHML